MLEANFMHPIVTEKTHVAFENSFLRLENNVVRNTSTKKEGLALRIAPADESLSLVVVLPRLVDGRLLLVGRFRYPTGRWSLEFPRLCRQYEDATWKEVAQDCLAHNAELTSPELRLLGAVAVDPALSSISTMVVLAEHCESAGKRRSDANQLIAGRVALEVEAVDHLICSGEITCGATLSAMSLWRAMTPAK